MDVKRVVSDSIYSICGLVLMNVIAQFGVYPIWADYLGSEEYGNILYLLAIINIISVSIGIALNNSRLVASTVQTTCNRNYNIILTSTSIVLLPFCIFINSFSQDTLIYWILMCLTMWRYYSDVEFRLNTNYRGYFLYYLIISIGYLFGILLFRYTHIWEFGLLIGELSGLIFVYFRGNSIRSIGLGQSSQLRKTVKSFFTLLVAQILSNLIFNADRVVLKNFFGGTAVTIYYLASLLGKTAALITGPLNSVIIGYLSKYKGNLSRYLLNRCVFFLSIGSIVATLFCSLVSHFVIGYLYPQEVEAVSKYFLYANLSPILYFASGILTTILLRFTKERYQVYINLIYAICFICFISIGVYKRNLWLFVICNCIVSFIRLITAAMLGYYFCSQNKLGDQNKWRK